MGSASNIAYGKYRDAQYTRQAGDFTDFAVTTPNRNMMGFKFNFDKLLDKAAEKAKKHIDGIEINLPFVTFSIKPTDIEKKVARELLIRLPDKRVLSSKECCDNCIDNSLASLQEIRKTLVDAQVNLADFHEGGLYLLVELMAEGVRQFVTFEEKLRIDSSTKDSVHFKDMYRPADIREQYFEVLEQLRFHIHSCLTQVATIADMETPKIESYLKSNKEWLLSLYHVPKQSLSN